MKTTHTPRQILLSTIIIILFSTCQKEPVTQADQNKPTKNQLSIQQAKTWYYQQPDIHHQAFDENIDWQQTSHSINSKGNPLLTVAIKGSPTFQNIKQGYRQLQFQLDSNQTISAKILEIIPDAIYHQGKQSLSPTDFSGRIFHYDLQYQLTKGYIYSLGKQIAQSRPITQEEQTAIKNHTLLTTMIGDQTYRTQNQKQNALNISGSCTWITSTYIDAEGIFTVYAESYCTFFIDSYPNTQDELKSIIIDGGGGGGGGSYSPPPPPDPSNLPMEEQPSKDPKKLMDCFGINLNPNAAYQVKILVQQPQPGTSFNIGQNAFGHVAIQLTKTEGQSTITQTLGFYPSGTGMDKLQGQSRIIDNGGLEYNTSATYYTNAQNFQNLINYIKNPPQNYHYTDFNCTSFAYQAALKAGLPVPNPSTQIGLGGPGGIATAMTPAGMASALNDYKASHPSADISNATMRAGASKGECN